MHDSKPILITSLPRSGSTWILRVIAAADRTLPMMEPDHLGEWHHGENGIHPYLRVNKEDKKYFHIYNEAFLGRTQRPFSFTKGYVGHLIRQFKSYSLRDKRVVVKTVYSLANTEWIYNRFNPDVLIILRNPYSLIHSIHRKWPEARLQSLLNQHDLVSDFLDPYKELIRAARSPYEILATRVGAYYKIILTLANRHPTWLLCTHEDLCRDPIRGFRRIFQKLNLEWSIEVENIINKSNSPKQSDMVQHVNRVASEEVDKWRHLLTVDEVKQISDFYLPFDNEYYADLL